jgi:hypothetical protein
VRNSTHAAICLEIIHLPASPTHQGFISTVSVDGRFLTPRQGTGNRLGREVIIVPGANVSATRKSDRLLFLIGKLLYRGCQLRTVEILMRLFHLEADEHEPGRLRLRVPTTLALPPNSEHRPSGRRRAGGFSSPLVHRRQRPPSAIAMASAPNLAFLHAPLPLIEDRPAAHGGPLIKGVICFCKAYFWPPKEGFIRDNLWKTEHSPAAHSVSSTAQCRNTSHFGLSRDKSTLHRIRVSLNLEAPNSLGRPARHSNLGRPHAPTLLLTLHAIVPSLENLQNHGRERIPNHGVDIFLRQVPSAICAAHPYSTSNVNPSCIDGWTYRPAHESLLITLVASDSLDKASASVYCTGISAGNHGLRRFVLLRHQNPPLYQLRAARNDPRCNAECLA